ncbi:MAG: hypothetical protein KDB82_15940, partial [Planctomycetes bacterium]|nr:hypothetical protein [Planctomycetota bacterium]
LQRANERIEGQKKTIESISGQLAEAETLADEHEARIVVLERENERLRRDLSDAQSKMLDSKGDVDEARESARLAEIEASRLKDQLKEERGKTTSVNSESLQLQKDLRDRSEELTRLKSELEDATQRLQRFEKNAEESNRKARDLEDELARANEKAAAAAQETSRLLDELKTARDEASNHRSASEGLTRETEGQRTELEKVRAELAALQESSSRHGNQGAELRAKAVELEQQLAAMRIEKESDAELAEDRRKKLEERLDLASERAANADTERAALQEMLDRTERARAGERAELEALVERERNKTVSDEGALAQTNAQVKELQDKLNESEAFLIKRQREFERADKQLKSLLDEVRAVADLRAKYEKAKPGKKQEELASQIGRRMDSLFSAAGRPINADRRTEKLVILTVKKSDEEIEAESNKPFVATNKDEDESNEDADDEAES